MFIILKEFKWFRKSLGGFWGYPEKGCGIETPHNRWNRITELEYDVFAWKKRENYTEVSK